MKKLSFFLMAMILCYAPALRAADVTETIAMKKFGGLSTNAYENLTKTGTSDKGTEMVAYAFNPTTGQVRGNKTAIAGASVTSADANKNWSLYNTQAMPGAIKKITVTQTATGTNKFQNNLFVALGTTNQGAVTTVTGAQKTTGTATEFTFVIDETQGYTYFKLFSNEKFTSGSVAGVVVTVTYAEAASNPDAVKYTVTAKVNDPAMGTVSGAGEYEEGKTATLTANANAGYKFVNWSNGSTDNPLKITVTENVELTANFEAIPPMTCAEAAAAASGATVVLNPFDVVYVVKGADYTYIKDDSGVNLIFDFNLDDQLKAGDHVEGFVGVSSPYNGLPELKPSIAFADLKVTPGTAPEPTLFTTVPGKADVNKYVKFEGVTLSANATFTTESATNATMVVNGTNVTLRNTFKLAATLSKDKTYDIVGFVAIYNSNIQVYFLSAEELVVNHTITVSANPAEAGTVTGGGEFEETDEITVKATANEGYEFVNWTEGEEVVSTNAEYTFEVLADRNLVANFIKKTISYELNGGAFPEVKVPTNAELWEAFKPYYNEYYLANGKLDAPRADQIIENVATFAANYMMDIMTDAASEYKWLGDYVAKVTTDAGRTIDTEVLWRFGVAAFFNCKAEATSTWNGNADFTEAGKPEVWGAAYLAEYGVVLPTEPVDAPYTLPTPVKEGYKFVGWYDNAEGTSEPMTVIPAGWDGTLYAIWVEIYTITVEAENGTVEGAGNYEHGAEATLTATAAEGYEFTCWTSGEDTVSTANPYKFTVTADVALVANFKLIPPTKYTVTLSDNTGGFEPLTSGAGEYEEGDEVTVSAVDSEGWVFVGWMDENGDIVSNDYQYTFVIEGNVELVAIYAQLMELEVNDLEIITEPVVGLTGTAELMPGMTLSFELIVDDSEQGEDGEFYLTEDSKVYLNDETELEFQEGIALIDMESKIAQAQVLVTMGETLILFNLDMSAAAAEIEATIIEIADATVIIEERSMGFGDEVYHVLKMESTWSDGETTYPVLLETTEFDQTKESQEVTASITVGGWGDEDPWLGSAEGNVTITVADGKVTVKGLLENAYALPAPIAFDVTISGTLPGGTTTALDNFNTTVAPVKMIENGQLIIINNGVQYNAQGQVIK